MTNNIFFSSQFIQNKLNIQRQHTLYFYYKKKNNSKPYSFRWVCATNNFAVTFQIVCKDITFESIMKLHILWFKSLASNYVKKGDNLFRNQINKKIAPNFGFPWWKLRVAWKVFLIYFSISPSFINKYENSFQTLHWGCIIFKKIFDFKISNQHKTGELWNIVDLCYYS